MLTKIRFLLLVLTLTLIGTAVTIHYTVTDDNMLELDQKKLTKKIHQFESKIDQIFADSLIVKTFQNVDRYPVQVAEITNNLTNKETIFFYIYRNYQLVHWSTNIYVPTTDLGFQTNTSFLQSDNRSFLVKRKELANNISVLALVPIKRNFKITNDYLNNSFLSVINVKNIEIAKYDDEKNIRNIYSKDGQYLFSVKLIEGKKDNIYINLQFFCWLAALICIMVLSHSVCLHIAKKGQAWLAALLFIAVLVTLRYIDLKSNWLSMHSSLQLFDPKYYAYNEYLPNIWAFLMTTASVFWVICFFRLIHKNLTVPSFLKTRTFSVIISFLAIFSIYFFGYIMYYYLGTLLTHSPQYENDFTQILNLGQYGWLCILILCFNVTSLILYIDSIILLTKYFLKDITFILNVELICIVVTLITAALLGINIFFCILFGFLIFLRFYGTYGIANPYKLSLFITSVLLLSAVSVIFYYHYNKIKKIEGMKQGIVHLLAEDDANAISLFIDLEKSITSDYQLERLLNIQHTERDAQLLTDYIKTRYLSGYLSKFEFQAYFYDNDGNPFVEYAADKTLEYREKVIKNAIKIPSTDNFYRLKSELGTHEYFTHLAIPYENETDKFYHVYLNLKNLSYSTALPYPELLSDNRINAWQHDAFQKNSYALYKDGNLVTQFGKFNYPDRDANMSAKLREYIHLTDSHGYYHMAYRPDVYTTIVLSKVKPTAWEYLALGSTFFILLLIFSGLFNIISYLIKTLSSKSFRLSRVKYHFRMLFNNIQYSTRIQTLVIISVLLGILTSGAIAFLSINKQLESNQSVLRQKEVAEIAKKIETNIANAKDDFNEKIVDLLKNMAPSTVTNFNLYDKSGRLLYSSQPRIFDLQLVSDFINPDALTKLAILRKSEAYEQERISNFRFSSAYASIKNEEYKTVAYLSIPYYASVKDATNSRNQLLNTILNIYTFMIILFGFIAVAVSGKITEPLNIVREKLAATQLSEKANEPLYWERNDEIGMLIKEYNFMLVKLEENAKQLRDAERENAWREMAKQVAHEIKNPLTPMKLGIQQLIRSFQENDQRFQERFERTSHSIIEQIDSLSTIATEFSAFAKLPETNMVKINLVEKIFKVINLFNSTVNTVITFSNNTEMEVISVLGDRDQLLRSFNNLFKNAIEASVGRRKHKINVTVERLAQDWIEVYIEDNGYGIAPDVIHNIFKPNFTTKSSGTGLGLAFVKQTVTAMGGKIRFRTRNDVGTVFIITLPLYEGS